MLWKFIKNLKLFKSLVVYWSILKVTSNIPSLCNLSYNDVMQLAVTVCKMTVANSLAWLAIVTTPDMFRHAFDSVKIWKVFLNSYHTLKPSTAILRCYRPVQSTDDAFLKVELLTT